MPSGENFSEPRPASQRRSDPFPRAAQPSVGIDAARSFMAAMVPSDQRAHCWSKITSDGASFRIVSRAPAGSREQGVRRARWPLS